MVKNSTGELKLSPVKEEGKFVFFNDFITINGKVSKGDKIKIFVSSYQQQNGKYIIDAATPAEAALVVRGVNHKFADIAGFDTIDKLYDHVAGLYKDKFYFGDKS